MKLTTTQKNDRLFKLAATKLALFPGAFDRFKLYFAASGTVRTTFEVYQALSQRVSDLVTADGQLLTLEAAEVVAFDRWARELIDEWFHENVNPFPPANDVPYQPVRAASPYPAITRAAAAQPAPAKARQRGDRDALAPLIRRAIKQAEADGSDPENTAVIFGILKKWARQEKAERPYPLMEIGMRAAAEVIRWEKADGSIADLAYEALQKRIRPRKPPTGGR